MVTSFPSLERNWIALAHKDARVLLANNGE